MAKSLAEWIESDVRPVQDRPIKWLSEYYFFRDPGRPNYSDSSCFFSPADGVLLYQKEVRPGEAVIDIKGKPYSLRDALRDGDFHAPCLVIGIFMTFFDVHVNRVPYAGRLSYRQLDPIDTYNHPMLDVEKGILNDLRIDENAAGFLHHNERMLNRIYAPNLKQEYFILQVADYDVDCITPFELKQNSPCEQGHRFSMIRYGSQVDLIVPLSSRYSYELCQPTHWHVEAGVDPLIRIVKKPQPPLIIKGEDHA
jgi:phosphatidylserine decarboxylase